MKARTTYLRIAHACRNVSEIFPADFSRVSCQTIRRKSHEQSGGVNQVQKSQWQRKLYLALMRAQWGQEASTFDSFNLIPGTESRLLKMFAFGEE